MALGPGSIAFVGYNYGQNQATDDLTFAILTDIPAGTVIHFSTKNWRGDGFGSSGFTWSWTATSDVAAGTIVTMEMTSTAAPTSNIGEVLGSSSISLSASEIVYAYVGAPDAPEAFLSAITDSSFAGRISDPATLDGTGLVEDLTAISLSENNSQVDVGVYNGLRLGSASFEDYLPLINDRANWTLQTGVGDLSQDGIAPDLPFSLAGFSDDPNVQVVNFAADSLAVSQAEGDSGETILTFTVERSGDTTGTVSFVGTIAIGGVTGADDFGGTAPVSFTGTIEAGQTSGTVTVRVSGDVLFEGDENLTLSLQTVSNDGANAVLGEDTVATGTIANDDPAPAGIAFVAYNAEGADTLNFVVVSDIAAGTVIHFNNNQWTGSSFDTGQAAWSWIAGSDIAAGTVVTMDGLNSGAASSNYGTISFTLGDGTEVFRPDLAETIYAYLGTQEQPTAFLTAMTTTSLRQRLEGTGLTEGVNALALSVSGYADIAQYHGPRIGETSFEDYLAHISNPANWTVQGHFAQDTTADGIFPDLPFQTLPFSTDPTAQIVQFADGSLSITQAEGDSGTETAFTFTVERANGTDGDLSFTVRVPGGTYSDAANGADFVGGTLPVVTGTIPDGQSSVTVTILVKGENFYELTERFQLILESASNVDASSVVIGNNTVAAGSITNDDTQPDRVLAGEHHSAPIRLTDDIHFVIEQGGSTRNITWRGDADIVIDNGGETGSITATGGSGGSVTINNLATGIIRGVVSAEDAGRTNYTLNNAGLIELAGDRMDLRDPADDGATVVVNNLAGGVIVQTSATQDIMRPGENAVVNNYGSILHAPGIAGGSSDGIDFQGDPGVVNNYAGGLIEASRHAVTGDASVTVYNEGTMIGRNGSAVNIDNNGTEAERAFITNRGHMEGRSANLADSDGDAVDIDGLLTLENYGFIGGMGHNGYHNGEPNVSEGLAIGGGTITNHAGGEIYGYGRAIQVDNSSNSNALGATTIVNHGLIRGDGNLPTGVTAEEVEQFAERIRGGEAINLLGDYGDEITNTGAIIGGVKMGGGDDLLVNKGTMTATGGSAVNLGDGNDTLEAYAGSTVNGLIDGGGGDDTLKLIGPGVGTLSANENFENLHVQGGVWTLQSDAYDSIDVATGAMVTSQLRLADQGEMTVAAGGSVLLTSGSDAVVAEGAASIENAGLIQALGVAGTTLAKAITINGGEIHNKAGGIILAQGAAIATGAGAVAGVEITNEGMIQSLSSQAIVLVGDQDDTVTNKGLIGGSVDLGGGDDTLNAHTTSVITGAIEGGEGDDTVNLFGPGAGSFGATSGFENLVVKGGTWSVADQARGYSDIVIKTGATVTSAIRIENSGVLTDESLTIEQGGHLQDTLTITNDLGNATDSVVLDNYGTIEKLTFGVAIGIGLESPDATVTLWNREGGVVQALNASSGGAVRIQADEGTKLVFNNAGLIESSGRGFQANDFEGESFVLNNLSTGIIRSLGGGETLRGKITEVNNAGRIEGGMEGFDYRNNVITFNNLDGGYIDGLHHAVTGDASATITNGVGGIMIGRNGSAVNIDNNGTEAERVFVTNRGTMEGRSAETEDSDGDAIDADGLLTLDNYGVIKGLGAEGYHNGEPNVSEGLAIGGGIIRNHAGGEIYGYGRGIQVDNSSNSNALGATTIINDGLIQGDGNGPEGVAPEDAAQFDLRGNEAINLIGDYADRLTNTGTIIGGVSMGGGDDVLENSGTMSATGGSAINMGAGDDRVTLHDGAVVTGLILLGDGEDRFAGADGAETVDGGAGDDLIEGGEGNDLIDGGADDDVIFGDGGDDRIIGGLGNDVIKGNAGDDTFVVLSTADGRDSYDGGAGIDTLDFSALSQAVNLTLKDSGTATFATDSIENIENVIGGSGNDKLTGNSAANILFGNDGADTLKGAAGNDTLDGGEGDDNLDGGADDDHLIGGAGDDVLKGAAGHDQLDGGEGDDALDGGAGNDTLSGGADDDVLNGGAGNDVIEGGSGADTLTGGGGFDKFVFTSVDEGVDTITDFKTSGASEDQLVLSASMFEDFTGDDPFDLVGSGFLRAVSCGGKTQIQIDVDGGGNSFVTLVNVNGTISNGVLADHVILQWDTIA